MYPIQILEIRSYFIRDYLSEDMRYGDRTQIGDRCRIKVFYECLDVERRIQSEIEGRKGRMVVSNGLFC